MRRKQEVNMRVLYSYCLLLFVYVCSYVLVLFIFPPVCLTSIYFYIIYSLFHLSSFIHSIHTFFSIFFLLSFISLLSFIPSFINS